MKTRRDNFTYKDLGYSPRLSRGLSEGGQPPLYDGSLAGGELGGTLPRPILRPRVISQADEPTTSDLPSNQMCFWIDTDDDSLYLCFNQSGTVKTVALT